MNKTRTEALLSARDGWHCYYCTVPLASPQLTAACLVTHDSKIGVISYAILPDGVKRATIDHKHPKSKGGSNALENLVLACESCNTQKNNRFTADQFLAKKQPLFEEQLLKIEATHV